MKKHILLFSLLLAGWSVSAQQIGNPGFESWTLIDTTWDGQPIMGADNWAGGAQTTDSHTGAFAAKVEPMAACGIAQGYMVYGDNPNNYPLWFPDPQFTGFGRPINFKPTSVSGYFKLLTPAPDDVATGTVILKKHNAITHLSEEIGRGEVTFTATTDYTAFTIAIDDFAPGVMPDSVVVAFSSGMGYDWNFTDNTIEMGTLYVDQLRFQGGLGTAGIGEQALLSCTFFPNPSSDQMQYTFSASVNDDFELVIADAAGKIVFTEKTTAGTHTIDISAFAAGSYRASIRGKETYMTQTLVVTD